MADLTQEPQSATITKGQEQDSLVFSILSNITLTFVGYNWSIDKLRISYLDNATQEKKQNIITTTNNEYVFTTTWLNNFYNTAFNGSSATLELEIFHLNAQLLQVVDKTIFVAFKDQPIITPIQGLLPLPFSSPFADIGIRTAVPQQTPEGSDELSWKSGYTEPYQRPTNRDGKWIKMGQYNQILYDVTKSALVLQDNLSILADYISGEFDVKLNDIDEKVTEIASKPPANAVLLTGNQSVAGLKNFTGVNINNFKTSPTAVANTELSQGFPIWSVELYNRILNVGANFTISNKNVQFTANIGLVFCYCIMTINNKVAISFKNEYMCGAPQTICFRNKDVLKFVESDASSVSNNVEYFITGS